MTGLKRIPSTLCLVLLSAVTGSTVANAGEKESLPHLVIIFCSDFGYGDLGCFGHPTIRTPHLDRMAAEGMKLTPKASRRTQIQHGPGEIAA